jgi:hypothetical protein
MEYPKFYGPDDMPEAVRFLVERLLPPLVEGSHPALVALQQQIPQVRIAKVELTGVGFFVDFEDAGNAPLAEPANFVGGNAVITVAGATAPAGCVLFVSNGRISLLEGYTCGDDIWPEDAEVSVEDVIPIHPG